MTTTKIPKNVTYGEPQADLSAWLAGRPGQWRALAGAGQIEDTGRAALRAAWVLASIAEDLEAAARKASGAMAGPKAVVWAAFRTVHWVKEASRCGQGESLLRCLAEAACSNLALRGVLLEHHSGEASGCRRREVLLRQSRRLGRTLWSLCEQAGRSAACSGWPELNFGCNECA